MERADGREELHTFYMINPIHDLWFDLSQVSREEAERVRDTLVLGHDRTESPDGTRLISIQPSGADCMLYDISGEHPVALGQVSCTGRLPGGALSDPLWSPDNQRVAATVSNGFRTSFAFPIGPFYPEMEHPDGVAGLTYEALRDHPRIRDAYAGKFAMVMIDEFQDTDQQQVDLINFLTGEGGRALCTVGDAQQSIYRFRGAEVEVFRRAQRRIEQGAAAGSEGSVVKLVKNFRSHAEVLEYVARVFDDGQGGIMPSFLNLLPHDGRADGLRVAGASRRQALLVAGGTTEERTAAKAEAIAKRFRALADAGQPAGDMVLLLGGMTRAGVYADAIRAQGLDCVISGGSVFASTEEAKTIRALVHMLGNLADTAQGLAPVLASPLFALGVQEFLALATAWDCLLYTSPSPRDTR